MNARTGYVWHELYGWHDTGTDAGMIAPGGFVQAYQTFENPQSKTRFAGLVEVSGLIDKLHRIPAQRVNDNQVLRVHTAEHVARLKTASSAPRGGDAGDGATPVGRGSWEIATLAAGGTLAAANAVIDHTVRNAYALVRPPGHHAERGMGRGYCLLSNVAIAIEDIRANRDVERVAIVDYDVHHGNGAQSIYWDDPNVLTISIHQENLFPTTGGEVSERGGAGAEGSCINIPLPAGCGNGAYAAAVERIVMPAVHAFAPDVIFVSSGFDPGALDPLGCMTMTAQGFREMATQLVSLADDVCDGAIVFSHEGGYSPVQVPFCGIAVLEAMSGESTDVVDPFSPSFDDSPAQQLRSWQDEAIRRAETALTMLSGGW